MAIDYPHIENPDEAAYFPPKGAFTTFTDDGHYEEKVRAWTLVTTKEVKQEFWYKTKTYKRLVRLKGYETHGPLDVAVIEFQDGSLSCILPAYLKEMQAPTFGKESLFGEAEAAAEPTPASKAAAPAAKAAAPKAAAKPKPATQPKQPAAPTLSLPTEKVSFTAVVKGFDTKPNPFSEEDDEVVLYEQVTAAGEPPLALGQAWSSFSKTLQKFELAPGDQLTFEAKVAKKKFNQDIVYKINNPSKIVKQ